MPIAVSTQGSNNVPIHCADGYSYVAIVSTTVVAYAGANAVIVGTASIAVAGFADAAIAGMTRAAAAGDAGANVGVLDTRAGVLTGAIVGTASITSASLSPEFAT